MVLCTFFQSSTNCRKPETGGGCLFSGSVLFRRYTIFLLLPFILFYSAILFCLLSFSGIRERSVWNKVNVLRVICILLYINVCYIKLSLLLSFLSFLRRTGYRSQRRHGSIYFVLFSFILSYCSFFVSFIGVLFPPVFDIYESLDGAILYFFSIF